MARDDRAWSSRAQRGIAILPTEGSQFSVLGSRFSVPGSRFPVPRSPFPVPAAARSARRYRFQAGLTSSLELYVRRVTAFPSAFIVKISRSTEARVLENAICLPSGDQDGSASDPELDGPSVSRVSCLVSRFTTKTSVLPPSKSPAVNAICLPPGAQLGRPTWTPSFVRRVTCRPSTATRYRSQVPVSPASRVLTN